MAVRVALVPDKGLGVIWRCRPHARETREAGVDIHLQPHDCGSGGETKCGASVTHIAIVDGGSLPAPLRVVGVCKRHITAAA